MIDCSHANSSKDYKRQPLVARDIAGQVVAGDKRIIGVMIESNLLEGRQDYGPEALYGMSVTDACMSLSQTEPVLESLAAAVDRGPRAILADR